MYIMLDKANFRGVAQIPGNLAKDFETIKDELKTAGRRLDWDVRAKADAEQNLKKMIRSIDEQANLLKEMAEFLAKAYLIYSGIEKVIATKWENDYAKVNKSFLGMVDFDILAPFSLANVVSTAGSVSAYVKTRKKILDGYDIKRFKDGSIKVSQKFLDALDDDPIKGVVRYISGDEIKSALKDGILLEGAEYASKTAAIKGAFNKLGMFGLGWEVGANAAENLYKGESTNKIIGDALGDVAVGVTTTIAGALVVSTLPVTASLATVAAVGLGASVGLTYATDGIRWNIDLNNDDEGDTIKDMAKHGIGQLTETVAGWIK